MSVGSYGWERDLAMPRRIQIRTGPRACSRILVLKDGKLALAVEPVFKTRLFAEGAR